jgi:hypothetical protein
MANKYQLDKLLKKKGWTGKEVGQLLIASLLNDIKQLGQGEKTPLFSQADFEKMESSLNSDFDYLSYGVYRELYSSIIDSFNRGQGLCQQFYNGFSRLYLMLREVQIADKVQKAYDDTPLIMTESQYKRLEAEAVQTLKGRKESYYSLLFYILEKSLDAGDEAPEPIRTAIEATKEIPAEKITFSRSYNEQMGLGYYSLPDGRRSDQMTSEEWQKALEEEFLRTHKLTINGEPASTEETIREYNIDRLIKGYELFFKGAKAIREFVLERTGKELDGTDEEIEEALDGIIDYVGKARYNPNAEKIEEALGFSTPAEWHTYEELPEGLTAYDLLHLIAESSSYEETDEKKHLKAFKTEYKELYTALNAYIEENVPKARGLKPNQLYKDIVSWGELADAGIIGYSSLIQPDDREIVQIWTEGEDTTENKSKRLRAGRRGIAILRNPASYQTDENGDYIEKKSPLPFFLSLYTLEGDGDKIAEINSHIDNLIYPALSYLYAFNSLMGIIGKVYDLPELEEVARFDTRIFESHMSGYNGMLYLFYHNVYGNEEEKQRKRAIIKEIFRPLEADTLKPSQEAIEEVTAELTKLGFSSDARKKLRYLDAFIDRLMNSREGAL